MTILSKTLGTTIFSLTLVFGLGVLAASASPADTLQPASTITYNEEVVVNNTLKANSAYIGSTAAGVGGVTFFNGTMINNSVDEDGGSTIPLTLGDDVRIDGEIYRTEVGGDNPLKLADTIRPQTNNTYDLGTTTFQFKDGHFAGALTAGSTTTSGSVTAGSIVTAGTVDGVDVSTIPSTYVSQTTPSWNAQTGRISIPGVSFTPEGVAAMSFVQYSPAGVLYLQGGGGGQVDFYAPLQLPDGATITGITLDYWDNTGDAENITATLQRVAFADASISSLSNSLVTTTEGAIGNTVSDTSIDNPVVDNDSYAYLVQATFSDGNQTTNLRIVGVEVTYTFTSPY